MQRKRFFVLYRTYDLALILFKILTYYILFSKRTHPTIYYLQTDRTLLLYILFAKRSHPNIYYLQKDPTLLYIIYIWGGGVSISVDDRIIFSQRN